MNNKTLIPPGAGQNKIIRMCYLWKKLPGSKIKTLNIENTTPNPLHVFHLHKNLLIHLWQIKNL